MKHFAWISGLGFLLAAAGASSGCTVSVTSASTDGGDDAASGFGEESSTAVDAAVAPDSSTSPETGATPEASVDTGAGPDASDMLDGSDGGACSVLQTVTFGSMACDQCLGDHCCSESTACFTGSENECESAVSCFRDCIAGNADAGVAPGDSTSCESACAGLDAMASAFDAWVTCATNQCASMCQ